MFSDIAADLILLLFTLLRPLSLIYGTIDYSKRAEELLLKSIGPS